MSGFNGFMPNNNMNFNNMNMNPFQNQINQLDRYMEQLPGGQSQSRSQIQQKTNMDFIKVRNMQEAREWIVQNGCSVWMRDSVEPYLYFKSVDDLGSPNFRIIEINDVTEKFFNGRPQSQEVNMNQYVPIENFNQLNAKVDGLEKELNMYREFINSLTQSQNNNVVEEQKTTKQVGRPKSNSTPKEGES